MNKDDLRKRTKKFALDVIKFVEALPKREEAEILGRQLIRSRTSVGTNYRAACRARSSADFVSKMGIVEEEADESIYWMELLVDSGIVTSPNAAKIMSEADEILAMTVSSIRTARRTQQMKNDNDRKTPQSANRNPQSDETPQSELRNPKCILIIDDSEDDVLLTQMVLTKIRENIKVEAAFSGVAGLAFLRGGDSLPTLILLDLKMPGMDGLNTLRAIRTDERLCRIPVVVLTHSDLESDREASYKSGANSFLNKSVDLDQFTEKIRNELERWI